MPEIARAVFSTDGFMPHGHCYLWNPTLLWLHAISDALIVLAYTSIPFTLFYIVRKRTDLPFNFIVVCFSVFIIACGSTHFMEIWTLWRPSYWVAGALKLVTATASVMTAFLLVRLVPQALAIPSSRTLAAAHAQLQRAHEALEDRVAERTQELTQRNADLAAEVVQRKRAEAALSVSEARFRRLSDAGIIGIITADLRGEVVEANDTFLDMLGYTREDVTTGNLRWPGLTPPGWAQSDAHALEQLMRTGIVKAREKQYLRKDGRVIPVLVGAAMLDDTSGQCVSFVLDLSEQKQAVAALAGLRAERALDAKFRALLDAAPDAMVVASDSGIITLVNAQTENLFGYTRSELIGQPLDLLIPERFRSAHGNHVTRFFANPAARAMGGTGFDLFARRKDGSELPIEVSLSPMRSDEGVTVSAAIRDISERRRMEAEARLLAQRLSSAVESIQDAFALFDDKDHLVLCNSVYRRLIGDSLGGALVGRRYDELYGAWLDQFDFTDAAERERFRVERLKHRRTEPTATFDVRLRDGRHLRVTDRRTAEGGTVKTVWDLTDDVRLAEELREARVVAESANNAKSEFLSSMSHELRTPLNAILGFAQLLQKDRKQPLSERHRERVAHIIKGGEHLLHLINDILDLSRIEAGSVPIVIEPLRVSDVLHDVRTTLEPMAEHAGIQLAMDVLRSDLPLLAADRRRFVQILMNFGSNAIKYNRPAGQVFFSVTLQPGGVIRVSVRDTGIGIPADKQANLFQPFQRAGQEAGPIEGTGIGLFITKRLVDLMHGAVGFRSELGVGSEFWVDMPVHAADRINRPLSVHPAASAAQTATTQSRLILYVEDNPANVAFMADLIDSLDDLELLTAASAEHGVELARERRPQIIVMDINLPGLSGFDALRMLQQNEWTRHIPVIALTAAASELDRKRGEQAGFHRYLTKPLNIDAFLAALNELL